MGGSTRSPSPGTGFTRPNRVRLPVSPDPGIATPRASLNAGSRATGWWVELPNILTVTRLVLAGALIVLLSLWRYPKLDGAFTPPTTVMLWSAGLFSLGALTDLLDGLLARRWGVISKFGRIMDPFADKLLVVGAFGLMAGPAFDCALPSGKSLQVSGVLPWMAIVILSRELLVTTIRTVLEARGIDFSASLSGKAKMVVQCGCVIGVFLILSFANPMPGMAARAVIDVLVWTAVIVTALSVVPYALRAIQVSAATP